MNLVIDIGNSTIKIGVFDRTGIVKIGRCSLDDLQPIEELLRNHPNIKRAIISSVISIAASVEEVVAKHIGEVLLLDAKTPVPVENLYKSKDTLGKDRLAAAVGGNASFPGEPVLVIDAGTALTIEFINKKNQYLGGSISPGLKMRFRALHEFTGRLPFVRPEGSFDMPANETVASIISGVVFGIVSEIEGVVKAYKDKYAGLKVIMTGGDSGFLDELIKSSIFVDPDLVLKGLNRILEYNADSD